MTERFFFVLVYEKSSSLVKAVVLGSGDEKLIQGAILKRKDELRVQYPESEFEVIVGGMVSSVSEVQFAFSHLQGWDQAIQEELVV